MTNLAGIPRPGPAPVEIAQQEREAALIELLDSARQRGDKAEFRRLWVQYAAVHAQRPAAMVDRMEREQCLKR